MDNHQKLIQNYLDGLLSEKEEKHFELLIASGEIDVDVLNEFEFSKNLDAISIPEPSSNMRTNFYAFLETQQQLEEPKQIRLKTFWNNFIHQLTIPKIGYAALLLVCGGLIGAALNNNNDEIQALSHEMLTLKEMMVVSMLEGASSTDRLKAVNISAELPLADKKAVHALLYTLNNDESVNVRVQTIEALKKWGNDENVREGLVNAIISEQSEVVLIALADAMIDLELTNSKQNLENVILDRDLSIGVKDKIQHTISIL